MFVTAGSTPDLGRTLTRDAAERVSRNWGMLLLNGALLVVAGVLIFGIQWSLRSLATFIGVLFIVEGLSLALTSGLDRRVRQTNVFSGLVSIATGVAIIVWPGPGIVAVAIVLGAWLIVGGTLAISGAFAARRVMPDWWLLLIVGLLEIPLGVLALADPGATLAALITVSGIWAVAVGVTRIILAFQLKRLPAELDRTWSTAPSNGVTRQATPPTAAHA